MRDGSLLYVGRSSTIRGRVTAEGPATLVAGDTLRVDGEITSAWRLDIFADEVTVRGDAGQDHEPQAVRFWITGSKGEIGGNARVAGLIYVPGGSLTVSGTAEFFGAASASHGIVVKGDAVIHRDVSLAEPGGVADMPPLIESGCEAVDARDYAPCDDGDPATLLSFCNAGLCVGVDDLDADGLLDARDCILGTRVLSSTLHDLEVRVDGSASFAGNEYQGTHHVDVVTSAGPVLEFDWDCTRSLILAEIRVERVADAVRTWGLVAATQFPCDATKSLHLPSTDPAPRVCVTDEPVSATEVEAFLGRRDGGCEGPNDVLIECGPVPCPGGCEGATCTYLPASGTVRIDGLHHTHACLCEGLSCQNCAAPQLPQCLSFPDNDFDGHSPSCGDCDDSDPTVHPGAPEICDGKDNDCSFDVATLQACVVECIGDSHDLGAVLCPVYCALLLGAFAEELGAFVPTGDNPCATNLCFLGEVEALPVAAGEACPDGAPADCALAACLGGTCVQSYEMLGLSEPCSTSAVPKGFCNPGGTCRVTGPEVCDGEDNDGDGQLDVWADGTPAGAPCGYDGPDGTAFVGRCLPETRGCLDGEPFGPCVDTQVLPAEERCRTPLVVDGLLVAGPGTDDDCDGIIDEWGPEEGCDCVGPRSVRETGDPQIKWPSEWESVAGITSVDNGDECRFSFECSSSLCVPWEGVSVCAPRRQLTSTCLGDLAEDVPGTPDDPVAAVMEDGRCRALSSFYGSGLGCLTAFDSYCVDRIDFEPACAPCADGHPCGKNEDCDSGGCARNWGGGPGTCMTRRCELGDVTMCSFAFGGIFTPAHAVDIEVCRPPDGLCIEAEHASDHCVLIGIFGNKHWVCDGSLSCEP
jgi:hypothetical protein